MKVRGLAVFTDSVFIYLLILSPFLFLSVLEKQLVFL